MRILIEGINLLQLVEHDTQLKKVAGTNGGEWAGACPFCGGKDRFRIWPYPQRGNPRMWCRQCGFSGDGIAYIMRRHNVSFKEAVSVLGVKPLAQVKAKSDLRGSPAPACFSPGWQDHANAFMNSCSDELHQRWDQGIGRYLEDRGITRQLASIYDLGLNIKDERMQWGKVAVWLPRGIVIPWCYDGVYWNLRVRRPAVDIAAGGPKYISPKGVANCLYNAQLVRTNHIVIMVEGEFDCMLLDYELIRSRAYEYSVVATGSASGARLLQWLTLLGLVRKVLLAFDADCAGDTAANWWSQYLSNSTRLKPTKKDITEMWQAGEDLVSWVRQWK
jgi:DNA primase